MCIFLMFSHVVLADMKRRLMNHVVDHQIFSVFYEYPSSALLSLSPSLFVSLSF